MALNRKTLTSITVFIILLVALGFFIYSDLKSSDEAGSLEETGKNDENIEGQSTTTLKTEDSTEDSSEIVYEELPKAPIPGLDREFVISVEIYGQEIVKNTMEQYNSLLLALKENPELRDEWLQLAILRKSIEDFEGAREIWVYVSKVWPLDHVAFGNLGDLYTNYLVDYTKAEVNLIFALERRPDYLQYSQNLYNLYRFKLENPANALEVLFSGRGFFPDEIFFPLRIAEHYSDTENLVEAKKFFEITLSLAKELSLVDIENYVSGELEKF